MKKFIIFFLIVPFFAIAQIKNSTDKPGIHFETSLSWSQILSKAKRENKYIFVDCYATWCGPCKQMDATIFPLPEVGDYFNSHFVNVRVQMDRTDDDNAQVKSWYAIADNTFKVRYTVNAYPTYLFFTPMGEIVHRIVGIGGIEKGNDFVSKAADAYNPTKAYYKRQAAYMAVKKEWKNHPTDSAFLLKAIDSAQIFKDSENAIAIAKVYLSNVKTLWQAGNLKIALQYLRSVNDAQFAQILYNRQKAAELLGKNLASIDDKLKGIIENDIIIKRLYDTVTHKPVPVDWTKLESTLKKAYPDFADELAAKWKMNYTKDSENWPEYNKTVEYFTENFLIPQKRNFEINSRCWDIFCYVNDQSLLKKAVIWMQPLMAAYPNLDWENVDTYAELLYKSGDTKNGIFWEQKAIAIAQDKKQKKGFEESLVKMKEGEKTWKD